MRTRVLLALLVLGLLALGVRAPIVAAAQEDPWSDDEEWAADCDRESASKKTVRLCEVRVEAMRAPHRTIRVEGGENGGVAIRGWDRDSLVVHARIQVNARSREEAEDVARRIRVVTDGPAVHAEGPPAGNGTSWAVSFHIAVPQRSDLSAETTNGPISAAGVEGTLNFRTVNGPVELSEVGGDVRARAVNGPLEIELAGSRWRGAGLDAETTNGPVELTIPEGYNARLETGTSNGPLEAIDIPIKTRQLSSRRIVADLGSGGATIRVVTHNGPVSVRQSGSKSD